MTRAFDIVLVLSGGNALGAFEAGVYHALHEMGLIPDWVVGASIGAINGALIAGSAPERRIETLRGFWGPDRFGLPAAGTPWLPSAVETGRRSAAASWTMAAGRPGIFGPLLSSVMSPTADLWSGERSSLFGTGDLAATLERLVDFDRIADGPCRFTATAVDLQTGDDVVFDSRAQRLGPDHVRASAALPIAFPPVEIDGQWLVDGGLSANLPLDPVFATPPSRPMLCIAVDLLPLGQPLPTTLGETAGRIQDLIFAAQSRRSIARWRDVHMHRGDIGVTPLRLAYTTQAHEVAGKALDFSGPTAEQRWSDGQAAASAALRRFLDKTASVASEGFHLLDADGSTTRR